MALEIEKFERGKCFICNLECDVNGYVHYQCAIAYSDEKEKRLKTYWDNKK